MTMSEELPLPIENKIKPPNITKEVFKVGGIVLLIVSIVPIIHTIYFLAKLLPNYLENGSGVNPYGEWSFGIDIGFLISDWLFVVIPLVIPAMIGKRILYTENKSLIFFIMPILTIFLAVAMFFIGVEITGRLSRL